VHHNHYKDEDENLRQSSTVKHVADSLQAATAFAIRTLRHTNAEEVVGGKSFLDSANVAETNQEDIAKAFMAVLQEMQVNEATSIGNTVATSIPMDTERRANRNVGKKMTSAVAIPTVATEGRPNRNVGKKKTPITTEGLPNKGSTSKGKGTKSKGKSILYKTEI
jgi:hypothetical protein